VAITNQNAVGHASHLKANNKYSDDPSDMAKTGRHRLSLFWLVTAMVNYWVVSQPTYR